MLGIIPGTCMFVVILITYVNFTPFLKESYIIGIIINNMTQQWIQWIFIIWIIVHLDSFRGG